MDINDLVQTTEVDETTITFDGIKPVVRIYEELAASRVANNLSFTGGIRLSNIISRLQQQILAAGGLTEEALEDAELLEEIGDCISDEDKNYLYGIYLMI